uniref:Tetraspanin n=1 Tax=Oryza nivara TaxID=4536 RepID=A0A0E0J8L5_ORYNI
MALFGVREYRQFERMTPERRAEYLVGMAGVLTLVTSIVLLLSGSTYGYSPKVCTGRGVFFGPTIALGLLLMAAFILGTCGQRYGDVCLFGCYLLGLLIAFPLLLAFIIFGYVAVGGIDLGGVSVREYNLEEYSGWLRGRVADPHYWETTSACLRDGDVCSGMTRLVRDPDTGIFVPELSPYERWLKEHGIKKGVHVMSPIESGCCKPPSSCGFTYVNGTTWIPTPAAAGAPAAATNVDCSRWSNNQQTLCFQCDSCKAGFLDDIKKAWSFDALYPILALVGAFLSCFAGVKYWRPRLDTGYSLIRERAVA